MKYMLLILIASAWLLCACNHNTAHTYPPLKWDNTKKLQFLSYGLAQSKITNATNVIAAKWGFEYHNMTGCVVNRKLVDSINNHNAQTYGLLSQRYGRNWHTRFNAEADLEALNEKRAIAILNQQPKVIAKRNQLKKKSNNLFYHLNPVQGQSSIYEAVVSGPGIVNGQATYVNYCKYKVDLKRNTVKLINDTIAKL